MATTNQIRIAVVDDDSSVRKAIKRLLMASDLMAETFASGEEFLDWLSQESVDCVILDLHMPKTGGLEILRRLANESVNTPVIVVTAHDAAESRAACVAAGAAAYLLKPLDERTLLAGIAKAINAHRARPLSSAREEETTKVGLSSN